MGYRVGLQCFDTYESALDYKVSQIIPVITQSGQLLAPVQNNGKWYIGQNEIALSFPQCDVVEQIENGALIGGAFVTLFIIIWGFRLIYRLISFTNDGTESES